MGDIHRLQSNELAVEVARERLVPPQKMDRVQMLCIVVSLALIAGVLLNGSMSIYRSLMGRGLPPHVQVPIK